jgi:hypothetical protein
VTAGVGALEAAGLALCAIRERQILALAKRRGGKKGAAHAGAALAEVAKHLHEIEESDMVAFWARYPHELEFVFAQQKT